MNSKREKIDKYFNWMSDEDPEKEDYLESILPSIGYVVMYFNALEKSLNDIICQFFSTESDKYGLIILDKMSFSAKVDLFKRLGDDFNSTLKLKSEIFDKLIQNLRESGRLRNLVIHADWENTDTENYTVVNFKATRDGIYQDYTQFSERSLTNIILLIMTTRDQLYIYLDEKLESM